MKKVICLVLVAVLALAMTACTYTIPLSATSNNVGTKCGKATTTIGDLVTGGMSNGIDTAAKAAGIKKISHVDLQVGIFEDGFLSFTTLVYGE